MVMLLWILAVGFVVAGIVALTRGQVVYGTALLVVAFAVGPGGASVST